MRKRTDEGEYHQPIDQLSTSPCFRHPSEGWGPTLVDNIFTLRPQTTNNRIVSVDGTKSPLCVTPALPRPNGQLDFSDAFLSEGLALGVTYMCGEYPFIAIPPYAVKDYFHMIERVRNP
jgi:hypothetical protein